MNFIIKKSKFYDSNENHLNLDSLIFGSIGGVMTKSYLSPGVDIILSTTTGSIAFPSVAVTVKSRFSICKMNITSIQSNTNQMIENYKTVQMKYIQTLKSDGHA